MKICLSSLISTISYAQDISDNHAPEVKILKPLVNNQFKWNSLIPYSIEIKDEEDGYSAYDEIANQEVILLIKYLENPSILPGYLKNIGADLNPLFTMSKSTCLSCHAATDKLIGPSFDLIAERYRNEENIRTYLIDKVIDGGKGVWGEEQMPTHPNLDNQEVGLLIDWILHQAENPTQFVIGLSGAIRTPEEPSDSEKSIYVLTAAYQDRGLPDKPNSKRFGISSIAFAP